MKERSQLPSRHIPFNITEDAVKSDARKLSVGSSPGGTDSEALQGWLLKFGEDSKILRTSVETLIDWLANGSPPRGILL